MKYVFILYDYNSNSMDQSPDELGKSNLFVPLVMEVQHINKEGEVESRKFYLADTEALWVPVW